MTLGFVHIILQLSQSRNTTDALAVASVRLAADIYFVYLAVVFLSLDSGGFS